MKKWQEYITKAMRLTNAFGHQAGADCRFFCGQNMFVATKENGNVFITYNSQPVFDTSSFHELNTYIEGPWQKEFERYTNRL